MRISRGCKRRRHIAPTWHSKSLRTQRPPVTYLFLPRHGDVTVTFETYIIPCVAWSLYYRTQERRDNAILKPPRCGVCEMRDDSWAATAVPRSRLGLARCIDGNDLVFCALALHDNARVDHARRRSPRHRTHLHACTRCCPQVAGRLDRRLHPQRHHHPQHGGRRPRLWRVQVGDGRRQVPHCLSAFDVRPWNQAKALLRTRDTARLSPGLTVPSGAYEECASQWRIRLGTRPAAEAQRCRSLPGDWDHWPARKCSLPAFTPPPPIASPQPFFLLSSVVGLIDAVSSFGLFAKCYNC
jgi:hypothetical protein